MRDVTIEINGMHCAACALLIDDVMLDVGGVTASRTDLRTNRCQVVVDDAVPDDALLAAVAEAGYSGRVL